MANPAATADDRTEPGRVQNVRNLVEGMRRTVEWHGDRVAIRTLDDSTSWTFRELLATAEDVARGLHELGVRHGDCVALMLGTRPDFQLCDLSAVLLGAAPFSIYQTFPVEQIEYVFRNSDARVAVIERAHLSLVREAVAALPHEVTIVLVDREDEQGCIGLAEVTASGRASSFDLAAAEADIDRDTLITLIYTSGTTGRPKGVEITHGNILGCARDFPSRVPLDQDSRIIGWLPAAHVAERIVSYYMPLLFGCEVTCCPDVKQIDAYLAAVRPTYFMGVPRIWEKLQGAIQSMWAAEPDAETIRYAFGLGLRRVRLEQQRASVPADLIAELEPLVARYFTPFRRRLGLDDLVTAHIGSAPAPAELIEFFHVIGVPLSEVWGMSETTAVGISNPPDAIRIGTLGLPTAGVEVRLAEDGEILLRSDAVTRGYRGMPTETAEAIVDGWLHTGDIGTPDPDGYMRLIGRKKEIMINAAGKNMSPAVIEAQIKSATPLIGQACCVGEGRRYNVAVLVLDPDYAPAWASRHGIQDTSLEALSWDPVIHEELTRAIGEANAKLSRPEQIKKFFVCPTDWQPAGDELTPTMKLKRSSVLEKYRADIAALYEDEIS